MAASVRDVVGGRARSYEGKLAAARTAALDDLRWEAMRVEAHAVVSVKIDHETIKGTMLMVTAVGTAVTLDG